MQLARFRFAFAPRRFGRGPARIIAPPYEPVALALRDELKLFATTFAAGFLFVSLLIA